MGSANGRQAQVGDRPYRVPVDVVESPLMLRHKRYTPNISLSTQIHLFRERKVTYKPGIAQFFFSELGVMKTNLA